MSKLDLKNRRFNLISSLGLGALLMYVLDPQTGRRREIQEDLKEGLRKCLAGLVASTADKTVSGQKSTIVARANVR